MTSDSLSPLKNLAESDLFIDDSKSISENHSIINAKLMSQSHPNNFITQIQTNLFGSSADIISNQNYDVNEAPPPTKKIAIPMRANSNCSSLVYNLRHRTPRRQGSLPQQKHCELVMVDGGLLNTNKEIKFSTSSKTYLMPTTLEIPQYGPKTTDFGRSLMAGVCTAYSTHFVLSG